MGLVTGVVLGCGFGYLFSQKDAQTVAEDDSDWESCSEDNGGVTETDEVLSSKLHKIVVRQYLKLG